MAKTITFKPEFEKKLKELKIKTKFVKNWIANKWNISSDPEYARHCALNAVEWKEFIIWAFNWDLTPEGHNYWDEIYHK